MNPQVPIYVTPTTSSQLPEPCLHKHQEGTPRLAAERGRTHIVILAPRPPFSKCVTVWHRKGESADGSGVGLEVRRKGGKEGM